ncbi:MAG TPA: murein biosynthesis integral membrane protein MurJ [Aggregatilineales bacterium]|nr:murein biosynthesis integral membrane protein MurJ [Aggregatilineales bacterium]
MASAKVRVLTSQGVTRATGIVAASFVLAGLLGVLRNAIISGQFGAGDALDAFNAAYRIPELLFTLIAGGALGSAFIPVYSRFLSKNDTVGAQRLASAQLTLILIFATVLAAIAAIFSPWLTAHILLSGAPAAKQALTADLTRIMLGTVVVFSASGLVMAILNANQHFLTPALAPSMNNLGLILGALLLTPSLGVYGLAWGAVLGSLLHIGIQVPALIQAGLRLRPLPNIRVPGVIEVFLLMGPRVFGSAVVQINFIVNTALTSSMKSGSLTALQYAFALMFTVLGVLGQSVGTAVFPTLSALHAQGDQAGFRRTLADAMRRVLFMSVPATAGIIVLARPLVATIYQHGLWTVEATTATTWALRFFVIGLVAFALQEVFARAFFALQDTITPVIVGAGAVALNVALSLIFIRFVQGSDPAQGPFGGLALSNALATIVETGVLWLLLRRRTGGMDERSVFDAAERFAIISLMMGIIVYAFARFADSLPPFLVLILGTAIGGVIFEIGALLFGIPEARTVPETLLRRFRRRA